MEDMTRISFASIDSRKFGGGTLVLLYAAFLYAVFTNGYAFALALLVTLLGGTFVATRFPILGVATLLLTGVIPTIFSNTPIYSEDYGLIAKGVFAVDLVLYCMAGAVLLRGVSHVLSYRPHLFKVSSLTLLILLFCLLILFEITRNWGLYGLSAPGEFRTRYLVLVLPLYIALFFRTEKKRKWLFRLLVLSSVFITLACVPAIGWLKGWAVGPQSRFTAADISLGLVYGLTALALAQKYRYIKMNPLLLWVVACLVAFLVLVDSNRSAWVATATIIAALFWLKEIRLQRISRWLIPCLLLVSIVWFAGSRAGLDVGQYIIQRASELVNPGGERDTNIGWRIARWNEQIPKFLASPILGEGFGGYWGEGEVSPHNLYVQTLVKTGLVGMVLYAAIMAKIFLLLSQWIRAHKASGDAEMPVVLAGLVILIGAHGFYVAYAFEYYTWMFVGLAVAVVRSSSQPKAGGSSIPQPSAING